MKSIEWFLGLILTWILVLTVNECYGFRVEHKLTPYDKWPRTKQYIEQQERKRWLSDSGMQKRGCKGFPCMYTHMGGSAGNASIKKAKLMLLKECVADPSCFSPGKRSTGNFDREYNLRRYLSLGDRSRDRSGVWGKETYLIPESRDTSLDSFKSYTNYEDPSLTSDTDTDIYYHYY